MLICREAIVEFLLGRCGSFADEEAEVCLGTVAHNLPHPAKPSLPPPFYALGMSDPSESPQNAPEQECALTVYPAAA